MLLHGRGKGSLGGGFILGLAGFDEVLVKLPIYMDV